ncbi:MAG: 1-deoxy-D-xylulose-5-phosphate reductoisomerase, partial [Sphingomonadales bacterium]
TVRRVIDAAEPLVPSSLQDIFSVDAASRAAAQHFVDQLEHA